jgi:hypothetical protein
MGVMIPYTLCIIMWYHEINITDNYVYGQKYVVLLSYITDSLLYDACIVVFWRRHSSTTTPTIWIHITCICITRR